MNELRPIFQLGIFEVTGYSLCMLAGLVLLCTLSLFLGRKKPGVCRMASFLLAVLPCAWAGARIVYVLPQLPMILSDPEYYGWKFILHPWEGGYTLYGAVLGAAVGGMIYAKASRTKAVELFDIAAPGAAGALCLIRVGEVFTSQGMGHYVEEEALQRFPFAVMGVYGEFHQPVFLYEAVAALAIMLVLLVGRKKHMRSTEVLVTLLGLSQVLLESLREDEIIRFGFVRFTQIAAISSVAIVMAVRLVRSIRRKGFRCSHAVRIIVLVAVVLVCIAIEFALDKSTINNHLLYLVMALSLTCLGFATLHKGKISLNCK